MTTDDDKAENAETFQRNMRMSIERDWTHADPQDAKDWWTQKNAREGLRIATREVDR